MKTLETDGWCMFDSIVTSKLLDELLVDFEDAYVKCRQIQIYNGITDRTDGTIHHVICFEGAFLKLLEVIGKWDPVVEQMEKYFGGKFILNSFGGVKNLQDNLSYVGDVHRDIRTYTEPVHLMLNMLIMLDDFTLENGATYLLSGSHLHPRRPSDEEFFSQAERAVASKGSIVLFNSNLWHAAGVNRTPQLRRALTLTFTKPFMKQQLDYPRFFEDSFFEGKTEWINQVLGYNARVPEDLQEWYQPREKRKYRSDQD